MLSLCLPSRLLHMLACLLPWFPAGPAHPSTVDWFQLLLELLPAVRQHMGLPLFTCLLTAVLCLLARLLPLLPASPAHPSTVDRSQLPDELLSAVLQHVNLPAC